MKLVEIVVLVGSQCVSPVQQTPHVTVAYKVPCAVVIQRDTEQNSAAVIPASGVNHPRVRAALGLPMEDASQPLKTGSLPETAPSAAKPMVKVFRPKPVASSTTGSPVAKKVPVQSGPPQPVPETVVAVEEPPQIEPASSGPDQLVEKQPNAAGGLATTEPQAAAETMPETDPSPAPEPRVADRAASADGGTEETTRHRNDKCLGAARPHWYTNKAGKRRYRCVIPGKTQLR